MSADTTTETPEITIYKLTDQHLRTYNGFQYQVGVEACATGTGGLCSPGLLHFYLTPLAAVLLNPMHADIQQPRLWRAASPDVPVMDRELKGGVRRMTLLEELPLPAMTTEQRVQVAIACAWPLMRAAGPWRRWALGWLRGGDRTRAADAADAAADAADAAADAASPHFLSTLATVYGETCRQTADRLEAER